MDLPQSQQQRTPEFREVLHPSGLRVFVPVEHVIVAQDVYVHDAKTTCRYASKRCTNPRTTKRNGELHSFCEMHRAKANQNQRRLESKKKLQREGAMTNSARGSASPDHPAAALASASPTHSSATSSPRFDTRSNKLASDQYYHSAVTLAPYSPEAFHTEPEHHDHHDHHAWVASHYYAYQQQQQQHHHALAHDLAHLHAEPAPFQSYASRLQQHQPAAEAYPPQFAAVSPQQQQQQQQLMDWELSGDLIGSSVAYAQTLNL